MRLSVDNGTVVCSLDNKNSGFLYACAGLFDGFLNGKLKMYWDNPEEFRIPSAAMLYNAERLEKILYHALKYGIESEDSVMELNGKLQALVGEIKAHRQAVKQRQEHQKNWEQLCKNGCGRCGHLAYDVDLPICKQTGEILKEENVPKEIGGVLRLFNFEPFPSEDCPFNINKIKEQENEQQQYERLPKISGSKI